MKAECKQALCNEWYELKFLRKGKELSGLLDLAVAVLGRLSSVVAVPPVSTVCCERGFSQANLVKNIFRSLLQPQTLSDLMVVKMNGPSLTELNPEKAVDQCYFKT